jgi:hypothetical protein
VLGWVSLVLAAALIVPAAVVVARGAVRDAGRQSGEGDVPVAARRRLETLWALLPLGFLALLIVLVARAA